MPQLITIGECMIELLANQPLEKADTFQRSLAGDTINILVAASRLGTTTGYITRLGRDHFANYLLNSWEKEGVETSQVKKVEGFNGVYFVSLLSGGEREFIYYRKDSAPSGMEPLDLDYNYIRQARILHISGITQAISKTARATVLRAAKIAYEEGVAVSYDPNYRPQLWTQQQARKGMEEILPYVTYMLPSSPADVEALFGISDPLESLEVMRGIGVQVVAVKCGKKGALLSAGEEVVKVPAHTPSTVVDTTGAGDAFNGGFLHGLLNGMDLLDAGRMGSIVAGLKVRGRGALTAMPTREEVYDSFNSVNSSLGS